MEREVYKFPDEKQAEDDAKDSISFEIESDTKPDIEVLNDVPETDRNRVPMENTPKDMTDDELSKYDESVQKRIKHFTKGYHEERRAKEEAQREREEALRLAQSVVAENRQLQGSLSKGQTALLEQAKKAVNVELEQAKRRFKEAYEAGDSDALAEAQEEMTNAKIKADRVNNFKPAPLQESKDSVQITQRALEPPVDHKAIEWQKRNSSWFGADDEMTSFALGLHTKLVKSGVDPQSDEYYEKLNSRLQQIFPDAFESERSVDAPTPPKKSNVAPATRSTAPRKIVLTQTQVNLAKRLGVPLELYARKVAEEQMRK